MKLDDICNSLDGLLDEMNKTNVVMHPLRPVVLMNWCNRLGETLQCLRQVRDEISAESPTDLEPPTDTPSE